MQGYRSRCPLLGRTFAPIPQTLFITSAINLAHKGLANPKSDQSNPLSAYSTGAIYADSTYGSTLPLVLAQPSSISS